MNPAPGERLLRFVGDRVRFSLRLPQPLPAGARALLRTNLGKADRTRHEVIRTHAGKNPMSIAFWRDVALELQPGGEWAIEIPLTDVGFYRAKAYYVDAQKRQIWPHGEDVGLSVHPNSYRTNNTIYCAFPRMFGPNKTARVTVDETWEKKLNKLDHLEYVVIPPSGKLRDLLRELPHIVDTLGCRILHLLPIGPAPTTFARMGRFGSPYACQDLTAIDPAYIDFDQRTNGVQQFEELTSAMHRRGGRVFLDMVINHTGWGSRLWEEHPEWFLRHADGTFASPGAWDVIWGDLVELNPKHVELWEDLARAFLTWCRRGVDGFRCDAGYKVPTQVWQYIEARVRQEFPETVFLLEGLGGPTEATETLLTEGGMQWAYSELFQNYGGADIARYLDYSFRQSGRLGIYVHYSETHDNNRLAAAGRAWSLMRNQLSALGSVAGGYGFTCGVEWLATEKFNVHSSRGLAWGSKENIVPELARLNRVLAEHPCFFDGAKVTRLSGPDSAALALRREAGASDDQALVLVNTDIHQKAALTLKAADYQALGAPQIDLLGQKAPAKTVTATDVRFELAPGAAYCLAAQREPKGLAGDAYRRARAQAAWGIGALSKLLLPEEIGVCDWQELARRVAADPKGFLGAAAHLDRRQARSDLLAALTAAQGKFPQVACWTLLDRRRVTLVAPGHWLLLQDTRPFRARLALDSVPSPPLEERPDEHTPMPREFSRPEEHVEAIEVADGYVACFPPRSLASARDGQLLIERYGVTTEKIEGVVRFLAARPAAPGVIEKPSAHALALLTNGRGGMARLRADFGGIESKYDGALAANLNSEFPVDRHVFVKRVRAWVNADGFITALNLQNLASFTAGPPAAWHFVAEAGDSRTVDIHMTAEMMAGSNTTVFTLARQPGAKAQDLPAPFDVRVILRADIEDRNFHWETHRNSGADDHFARHCRPLEKEIGFEFTPADDRRLRVILSAGSYQPEPEWAQGIPHPIEQSRAQAGHGDAYSPGWFGAPLRKGETVSLMLSAEALPPSFPAAGRAAEERRQKVERVLQQAGFPEDDSFGRRLAVAAQDFVARRGAGETIIAGYPWFLDWGRDTFISARGLVAAGLGSTAAELLVTFGRFEQAGTMPNIIHGADASNRDTSDAPLWYGVLCEETAASVGNDLFDTVVDAAGRTVAGVARSIALGYIQGTPNGIRMDAASGLIWSPSHFTWMDTNYPAGTPRQGYPVEIQVLWIRLLRLLQKLGAVAGGESWEALAQRAEQSLRKYFWLEDKGYLADVLLAHAGQSAAEATVDSALRSNYLLAIASGLFTGVEARRGVEAAWRYLLVPGGLRSLAPLPVATPLAIYSPDGRLLNNPLEPYWGRYEGDEDTRRKPAYHNGTAWTWTLPTACEALVKAWDFAPAAVAAAKATLGSMEALLSDNCVGQIPEILDGDAPHQPRGCDAQAWGTLETLRVWKWLNSL
ncbi:MAG TPA: amylo-alpha-1,6-glucosidase [Verrucomicrobiae bacterium]|nr:amylo-alpha-1,6-glucosidase [Verrucomicrobiae bacterium]